MAKRGAKPKPVKLHEVNGNPSKRNISKKLDFENNIEKIEDSNLEIPKILKDDKVGKEEWERVVPILSRLKILTELDLKALEMYCKSYSRYVTAEEEMDKLKSTFFKTPSGYVQQLPQYSISNTSSKICREIMAEFGMTPSSRSRMELPSEANDTNEMEDLLNGGG